MAEYNPFGGHKKRPSLNPFDSSFGSSDNSNDFGATTSPSSTASNPFGDTSAASNPFGTSTSNNPFGSSNSARAPRNSSDTRNESPASKNSASARLIAQKKSFEARKKSFEARKKNFENRKNSPAARTAPLGTQSSTLDRGELLALQGGYLEKKARGSKWQKRYFWIQDHCLVYRTSKMSSDVSNKRIDLRQADSCYLGQHEAEFYLTTRTTKNAYRALDDDMAGQWIKMLKAQIEAAKQAPPRMWKKVASPRPADKPPVADESDEDQSAWVSSDEEQNEANIYHSPRSLEQPINKPVKKTSFSKKQTKRPGYGFFTGKASMRQAHDAEVDGLTRQLEQQRVRVQELTKQLQLERQNVISLEGRLRSITQQHEDAQSEVVRLRSALDVVMEDSRTDCSEYVSKLRDKLRDGDIDANEYTHMKAMPPPVVTPAALTKESVVDRCRSTIRQMNKEGKEIEYQSMKERLIGEFGSNLFAEAQKEVIQIMRVAGANGTPRRVWQVRRKDRKMFTGLRKQASSKQSKEVFFNPHRKVKNGTQVYVLEDNLQPIPEQNVFFAKIQVIGNPEIQGYLKRTYLHPV